MQSRKQLLIGGRATPECEAPDLLTLKVECTWPTDYRLSGDGRRVLGFRQPSLRTRQRHFSVKRSRPTAKGYGGPANNFVGMLNTAHRPNAEPRIKIKMHSAREAQS